MLITGRFLPVQELEGIKTKGKGCPKPIKSWAQCGVSKKEMETLKKLGYEKPTPIQAQTIPAIMSGSARILCNATQPIVCK